MARILIVDDHQLFIDGLKSILSRHENMEEILEAQNGEQCLRILQSEHIDVVFMDVGMPGMDGFEVTSHIKEKHPDVKVLILTMHGSAEFVEKSLEVEVDGYILKNTGKEELFEAFTTLIQGGKFFSDSIKNSFMNSFGKKRKQTEEAQLSKREIEVLKLVAQEYTTAQIAEELFISQHTVDSHRKNLLSKLGLKNAAGLVRYAIGKGMV